MPLYQIQEADLHVPDAWQDRSINIFTVPATGVAQEASFVISRDASQSDTPFAEYIARQIHGAEQLPGFKLLKRWDFVHYCHVAVLLDYSWRRDGCEIALRQVFIELKPAVLITTLTMTPDDLAHHEPAWQQVMQSLVPQSQVI